MWRSSVLRGFSQTGIEEKLEHERRKRGKKTTAERMLEFANRFASGMPPDCISAGHAGLLHGEDGLPK